MLSFRSAHDRLNRFARLKGYSDVGALVTDVAQVPRGDAGRLVTLGGAMSDADAGSPQPLTIGASDTEHRSPAPCSMAFHRFRGLAHGEYLAREKDAGASMRRTLRSFESTVET